MEFNVCDLRPQCQYHYNDVGLDHARSVMRTNVHVLSEHAPYMVIAYVYNEQQSAQLTQSNRAIKGAAATLKVSVFVPPLFQMWGHEQANVSI